MHINILHIGLLTIIIGSCTSPMYLPSSDKIDVNEYGSYIKIVPKTASNIDGELISIDSNKIVVLTEEAKKCVTVSIHEINRFSLQYAESKHYGWAIPFGIILPFIHGAYSALTFPLHLIVSISVISGGKNAFKYSDKNMTYEQLKMFARFPQGIPADIDIASIK